jgi:hypothetical protein
MPLYKGIEASEVGVFNLTLTSLEPHFNLTLTSIGADCAKKGLNFEWKFGDM